MLKKKKQNEEEMAWGYGWEQNIVEGAGFGFGCSLSSCGKLGDMVYLNR